jgi:hypothetical protein
MADSLPPFTIFLDFDGVLHPAPTRSKGEEWCWLPRIETMLICALNDPSVQIVISSAWRIYHSVDELKRFVGPKIAAKVIDCTPCFEPSTREEECLTWLEANGLAGTPWVAIDDLVSDFKHHAAEHLVAIDPMFGPSLADLRRFIALQVRQHQRRMGQLVQEPMARLPSDFAPAVLIIDFDWMLTEDGRTQRPDARLGLEQLFERAQRYFELRLVAATSWLEAGRTERIAQALPGAMRAQLHPKMLHMGELLSVKHLAHFFEDEGLDEQPWAALVNGASLEAWPRQKSPVIELESPAVIRKRDSDRVLRALVDQAEQRHGDRFPMRWWIRPEKAEST